MRRSRANYLKYKETARLYIYERLDHYKEIYYFDFNRVSIRDQRTRWGSCSKKGNLNFNYRIMFLPKKTADYIIIHELCHLKEFNHSRKFWNLVAEIIPDYLEAKKELRFLRIT